MRRSLSIVKATALEVLSEPLTLLATLVALALAVLTPTWHFHQFGEPTRMAREAGFSATLVLGLVLSCFCTIRSFRREMELGTYEMALAHAVSERRFFLSKAVGAALAVFLAMASVFLASCVVVMGAAVGGRIADETGAMAQIWGPALAVGVATGVVPLVAAAFLNRFVRMRFILSSLALTFSLAVGGGAWVLFREPSLLLSSALAALPLFGLALLFVSAAAWAASRFKAHVAASWMGALVLLFLPFFGNYYLSDTLLKGGRVSASYVGLSLLATLPACGVFLVLGCTEKGGLGRDGRRQS